MIVRWRQQLILRTLVIPFWCVADRVRDHADQHGREMTGLEAWLVWAFDQLSIPGDLWVMRLNMREHQAWAARMQVLLEQARALLANTPS